MASTEGYLNYILDTLSETENVTYRKMMGEYILYYKGKVVGGIYDDRLLVKPVAAALKMLPEARKELPYEGAKEMLLVEETDNGDLLKELFEEMYGQLPEVKKRKKR